MNAVVDTNIFLDYAYNRRNGKFAFRFFKDTISCKHSIIMPKIIMTELKRQIPIEELEKIILLKLRKKNKIVILEETIEQTKRAQIICQEKQIPFPDALIALQAQEAGAIIVTRDKHFFFDLSPLVDCFKPEELL